MTEQGNNDRTIAEFQNIDEETVAQLIDMEEVLEAVEDVFVEYSKGEARMPPKIYLELPEFNGDFRAMPALASGYAGIKWVNVHPDNKEIGLPGVMAKVILSRPETGENLACLGGTHLTDYRTGAAGGIAAKYLAQENSKTLGLVGLGDQAKTQLLAISAIFDLETVKLYDVDQTAITNFKEEFSHLSLDLKKATLRETVASDIVSTVTPVREPIVEANWINEGTHINAMGADAEGKQEIESALFEQENVKVVVDDIEQAAHSGEINVPLAEGVITREKVSYNLPEVVAGEIPVRKEGDITVFDSTGLAIQDIAVAKVVYEKYIASANC